VIRLETLAQLEPVGRFRRPLELFINEHNRLTRDDAKPQPPVSLIGKSVLRFDLGKDRSRRRNPDPASWNPASARVAPERENTCPLVRIRRPAQLPRSNPLARGKPYAPNGTLRQSFGPLIQPNPDLVISQLHGFGLIFYG
jgi:hypothetical protein